MLSSCACSGRCVCAGRCAWLGEGYRKVWVQLRAKGIRVCKRRVLRLMRLANLLSPSRAFKLAVVKPHDGMIITDRPDVMWGTDQTGAVTASRVSKQPAPIDFVLVDEAACHHAVSLACLLDGLLDHPHRPLSELRRMPTSRSVLGRLLLRC